MGYEAILDVKNPDQTALLEKRKAQERAGASPREIFIGRKLIGQGRVVEQESLRGANNIVHDGNRQVLCCCHVVAQVHDDFVVAGRSLGGNPESPSAIHHEKPTLCGRVLDRAHHESFDQLLKNDLLGCRMRHLHHRGEVELFDQATPRCEGCVSSRVGIQGIAGSFQLTHFALGAPNRIPPPGVFQIGVADRFKSALLVEGAGQFAGQCLVMNEPILACEANGFLVETLRFEFTLLDAGGLRSDQRGAVGEVRGPIAFDELRSLAAAVAVPPHQREGRAPRATRR